jgi:GTP-binding protein Era
MNVASGFISIVGPPNVGKSTLLNRILGTKVAIVSPRPQTTRNRILGILNGEGYQMIFVDTPGIHPARTPLHRSMVASALSTFTEVDIILVMIEMSRPDAPEAKEILSALKGINKPCLLAVNKIDRGPKEPLLPLMDDYRRRYPFEGIFPISALTGEGVQILREDLKARLTPGPRFFPEEMKTDQSEAFLVSEVIREKIYHLLKEEVPYSSAVTVEGFREDPGRSLLSISATIHVESESQKKICIGRKGGMIKSVGSAAREDLEGMFGKKVFLQLFVKVDRNWSRDARALRRLGY